jgi:hypothetical protein
MVTQCTHLDSIRDVSPSNIGGSVVRAGYWCYVDNVILG